MFVAGFCSNTDSHHAKEKERGREREKKTMLLVSALWASLETLIIEMKYSRTYGKSWENGNEDQRRQS